MGWAGFSIQSAFARVSQLTRHMRTPLVFISHTTRDPRDRDLAHQIADSIRNRGGAVWIAPESIPKGAKWNAEIKSGVYGCSHFLVIITAASVQAKAVLEEITLAEARYAADPSVQILTLQIADVGPYAGREFLAGFQRIPYCSDPRKQLDEIAQAIGLGPYAVAPFKSLIREKTEGFVGRDYVFVEIEDFIEKQSCGYIIIEGDPGVGKTSILAEYFRRTGSIAFFNVASEGINQTSQFLESLSSQINARYKLSALSVPPDAKEHGPFLRRLLDDSSSLLKADKLVILVDALDEVDTSGLPGTANVLYLPTYVPERVYFVASVRSRAPDVRLTVQAPIRPIDLMSYSSESSRDAAEYIRRYAGRPAVRDWIGAQGLALEDLVAGLVSRSENNFMYLRYVLSDIERGLYGDRRLEKLPTGLESYYEDHWERMGMTTRTPPLQVKLKLIYILCEVRRPISRHLLEYFSDEDELTVQLVINEWGPFLHCYQVHNELRYAIYHASFRDFLHRKKIIDLREIRIRIAKKLRRELYGDDPRT
jgi:hypothetical protein